jgi:hypothetical protein
MSATRLHEVLTLQLPPEGLSADQYRRLEQALEEWAEEVKEAVGAYPAKSYELGVQQTVAFLRMLGAIGQADLPPSGAVGPTKRLAVEWLERYTLNEINGALDKYLDDIRNATLYGLQGGVNPTQVASWLYKATRDAQVNWRMIARTEMARANAAGRLDAVQAMGYEKVWIPPHTGACSSCRRLLEDKVFTIEQLRNATNYGQPVKNWVAALPLHPHCRHIPLPYLPDVVEESRRQTGLLAENGLDDKTLDEMFDSSGQLKPEYEGDPRLEALFEEAGKTVDPLDYALGKAVAKRRREEPPGLHHTSDPRIRCQHCTHHNGRDCDRYNWNVDDDEVCRSFEPSDDPSDEDLFLGKGFFDNPQAGLDPLLWADAHLRPQVRDRIVDWWRHTLGADAPLWSHLYLTGGATSRQWSGKRPDPDPDVDVQIVVDFAALREYRPEYGQLTDPELHLALATQVKARLDGVEAAPGLRLDAFVRPELSADAFEAGYATHVGQGVWDLGHGRWIIAPQRVPQSEVVEHGHFLEGLGGALEQAHPDWIELARRLSAEMTAALEEGDTDTLREAYHTVHDFRVDSFQGGGGNAGLGNFIWQYLVNFGPLMRVKHLLHDTPLSKVWPEYAWSTDTVTKAAPPATGTEHWITVHPHGEGEKGIPVLIRENGDGTATVIGGAGGHLDFLRIEHNARIKDDAKTKDRQAAEQAGSPEEAESQRATQEEAAERARTLKEHAQAELKESHGRVEDIVRGIVDQQGVLVAGEQVHWNDLSDAERKQLVKQAVHDSLYQSTYGQSHDLKRAEAPAGPIVVTPAPRDNEGDNEGDKKDRETEDRPVDTDDAERENETKPRTRLRIAMPTEHADLLQEEIAGATLTRRRVREANRVIGGEAKPADATSLEWEPVDKPQAAQRRAAEIARQEINRELLGQVDQARAKKTGRESMVEESIRRGAFDAFDSLTYSVFGKTLLPTNVQKLLGVNGTAQLLAHELQARAKNGEINLKTLQQMIDQVTEERQQKLIDLDLNRARAAAREAASMGEEYSASLRGESLFTLTAAKSRQSKKLREAADSLGMAISGSEALHSLRAILQQPIDEVKVAGYGSRSQILEKAQKAGVHVTDRDIVRNGPGNYSLRLDPDRMRDVLDVKPDRNEQLRAQLEKIRTGEDLDREIEKAQRPPGYSRVLDRAQAQGSMFLRAAGSGVLAFAPGVGKTDTAIASALEVMATKPGTKALIVAPKTALAGTWAKTIQKTCPGRSIQIFGQRGPEEGQEAAHDWEGAKGLSSKARAQQAQSGADFNIISFDTLKRNPELVKQLGHQIVITDEAQYAKNPGSQRLEGLDAAAEGVEHRWALTGTPLEKNMGELHTLVNWARPGAYGSRKQFTDRFAGINQYDHLTTEEKVQQFREGISDGLFFQSQNASNMPPFPDLKWEDAPLSDGHTEAYQQAVGDFNDQWQARRQAKEAGEVDLPQLPAFGGRDAQMAALMKPQARGYHGPNARVNRIADLVAQNKPVDFKGFKGHATHADGAHTGTYAPKTVIFGQQTQPLQPIREELERRGTHKVFYTDGSVSDNDQRLKDFMAHDGPAVLITSDTNKTARSLQFGDNSGSFQHGATQMIHADLPMNNADLQQRIARIWRRGSQAEVSNHIVYSGTPVERQGRDQLASELRTQQAVGNPEDKVERHGEERDTIGHKLRRAGQVRLRRRQTDASR